MARDLVTASMLRDGEPSPHVTAFLKKWCPPLVDDAEAFCIDLATMLRENDRLLGESIARRLADAGVDIPCGRCTNCVSGERGDCTHD